jgi:saccharopine dehydrogenase-like NADP-dependent oxidoreductase
MQGKTALHDLCGSEAVEMVVAADCNVEALTVYVEGLPLRDKVCCQGVDAAEPESLARLMEQGFDVVIDLLPGTFIDNVTRAAIDHGIHLINSMRTTPAMRAMVGEAEAKGITLLPELGMDPGIDQIMLGQALRSLDRVDAISAYGSGIPSLTAADNPLRYKVSWTFDGVLELYRRPARLIRGGKIVEIPGTEIFQPVNTHQVMIPGLGELEAYANGDFLATLDHLDIDTADLIDAGQYTLRWPGHCDFWKKIVDLHLLDEDPVVVDGIAVDRKRYLVAALEPHLQYGPDEQDLAILRVEAAGRRSGEPAKVIFQLIDQRDLDTGFSAMSRLVGFSTSIGAQMIGSGKITQRGLLSPARDVPYPAFTEELEKRGVEITAATQPA